MIQVPEDGWGADAVDVHSSLLDGSGVSTGDSLAGWSWADEELARAPADTADSTSERAVGIFRRQRGIGAFNRELDTVVASIAEAPDWSDGLERFDRQVEELRQRHAGGLRDAEDRDAFSRHAGEFAAMQRIGLKRALVERQASDALSQLDDQLAYYAGKAAGAEHDAFRQIALDSGLRAIDELREAGYLTVEGAEARRRAFMEVADGDSGEATISAEEGHSTNDRLAMGKRRSGRGLPGSRQPSERREPTPTDPVGRRGRNRELKVDPGTNPPGTIEGRAYSGHALDQMQGRGLSPSTIEQAIKDGVKSPGDYGRTIHHDRRNNITVVTEPTGEVVTVWPGRP